MGLAPVETPIREVVLPLVKVSTTPQGQTKFDGLLGTCFRMKGGDRVLTASHVFPDGSNPHALRVVNGEWRSYEVKLVAKHASHDIAVCKAEFPQAPASFLVVDSKPHYSSKDYHVWGYPADVLHEHGQQNAQGQVMERPDLVFTKGYIRRRYSSGLPVVPGNAFYELSEIAGGGCSGAPFITRWGTPDWLVGGIHSAQQTVQIGEDTPRERAFACRLHDALDFLAEHGAPVAA